MLSLGGAGIGPFAFEQSGVVEAGKSRVIPFAGGTGGPPVAVPVLVVLTMATTK